VARQYSYFHQICFLKLGIRGLTETLFEPSDPAFAGREAHPISTTNELHEE